MLYDLLVNIFDATLNFLFLLANVHEVIGAYSCDGDDCKYNEYVGEWKEGFVVGIFEGNLV